MSRTTRHIPFWVNRNLLVGTDAKFYDVRSEYQNGYDAHSRSPLKTCITDFWREDCGTYSRRFYKRKMSKYYRKVGLREIQSQLLD